MKPGRQAGARLWSAYRPCFLETGFYLETMKNRWSILRWKVNLTVSKCRRKVDLSEDYVNISIKTQWFGSRYGDEEGTDSRNIWELVFSGLGYVEWGRKKGLEDTTFLTWATGCMVLPFIKMWDMGYIMVNLARLLYLAVWSNTSLDVTMKVFF